MRVLGKEIDERFFTHRQRSTSTAGIVSAVGALLLFAYRFYWQHRPNWDLLAIGTLFVAVKLTLMIWYHLTD
ncbi:MAG: hypothetical protein JOZ10_19110 [Acidobacteria bacterium]|nr:hypothetical protein [Acidobacteriota bacterium]MBV9146520.1 hypothetical protein [Acidobacteriota bacterium]MBV9435460.1 hypothetical protein [Acidobacteriota bacterium]